MAKIPRSAKVEAIDFAANSRKTRNMPLTVLAGLQFNLEVTHVNGTSGADNDLWGLLNMIKKIELVLDGQDNIVSVPGYFLYYMNYFDFSQAPFSSIYTVNSNTGTSKVSTFLPFQFLRGVVPNDGLLDGRPLSSMVLNIDWDTKTLDGATSIDAASKLNIDTKEYSNVVNPDELRRSLARHEYAFESVSLTKSGEIQIDVPTKGTNQYYRVFLITKNSSGELANSIIDNIKFQTRSFVYMDKQADYVQKQNQLEYAIQYVDGVYVIDFTTLGLMSERLDARPLSELTLKVNSLVSSGSIDIVYEKAVFA